jgi:UDP-N-acetylglucosamine 1-carboxyvinyltransferase
MLNSMGANITGVGSNLLVIEGVKILVDVSIGFTWYDWNWELDWVSSDDQKWDYHKDVSWDNLGVIPSTLEKLELH